MVMAMNQPHFPSAFGPDATCGKQGDLVAGELSLHPPCYPFDFRPGFCFTKHGNYLRLSIDRSIFSSEIVLSSGVRPQAVFIPEIAAFIPEIIA